MEVTIIKKLFLTVDIDIPDDCTEEELSSAIVKEIKDKGDWIW